MFDSQAWFAESVALCADAAAFMHTRGHDGPAVVQALLQVNTVVHSTRTQKHKTAHSLSHLLTHTHTHIHTHSLSLAGHLLPTRRGHAYSASHHLAAEGCVAAGTGCECSGAHCGLT